MPMGDGGRRGLGVAAGAGGLGAAVAGGGCGADMP